MPKFLFIIALQVFLNSFTAFSQKIIHKDIVAVIKDVQKYNGAVLAVGELPDGFVADYQLNVGTGFSDVSREILYLPLLQLLAYYRTLKLQLNPDQPRNLSQVVKLK